MNRKGFTLIELIVTIALLAVIAVISFVSISKVLEQGKVNDCNSLVGNIKTATNEYISDNRYNREFVNTVIDDKVIITADTLINGSYLSGPIINPYDNKTEIPASSIVIEVTLRSDDYTVGKIEINSPDTLKACK